MAGQRILRDLDFPALPVVSMSRTPVRAALGPAEASIAVAARVVDTALVIGIEKMAQKGLLRMQHRTLDRHGPDHPRQLCDLGAAAHRGIRHPAEQFAWISVKDHDNGADNPYAMFRKRCTLEEVMNSRPIADPLTLLQCSAPASGAAAMVVVSAAVARRRRTPSPSRSSGARSSPR